MMMNEAGSRILGMLTEQYDLLRQVAELATVQSRVIEEDESEQLVAVLQQRSTILGKVTQLSKEITSAFAKLPTGDPQRALILQRREAVSELAQSIAQTDQAHTATLMQRRDELARTLAGMNTGRNAASAYLPAANRINPEYQDRQA